MILVYSEILRFRSKRNQEISGHFETKPTACHAWCDFQQIRYDAFVHALDSFLGNDHFDGVKYSFVLVSHPGHCVDLEATAKYITRIG